jgi:hypothetical protein
MHLICVCRSMHFDPEGNTTAAAAAAAQQQHGGYGAAAGGPTGNPYMQNGAAAYGGSPGAAYGGPTGGANGYGAPYGGPTGAYGGPTGAYGGPTGAYSGAANGAGPRAAAPVKLKDCSTPELLQHLPTIQKLLARLMQCVPEGASAVNPIILVSDGCSRLAMMCGLQHTCKQLLVVPLSLCLCFGACCPAAP